MEDLGNYVDAVVGGVAVAAAWVTSKFEWVKTQPKWVKVAVAVGTFLTIVLTLSAIQALF